MRAAWSAWSADWKSWSGSWRPLPRPLAMRSWRRHLEIFGWSNRIESDRIGLDGSEDTTQTVPRFQVILDEFLDPKSVIAPGSQSFWAKAFTLMRFAQWSNGMWARSKQNLQEIQTYSRLYTQKTTEWSDLTLEIEILRSWGSWTRVDLASSVALFSQPRFTCSTVRKKALRKGTTRACWHFKIF